MNKEMAGIFRKNNKDSAVLNVVQKAMRQALTNNGYIWKGKAWINKQEKTSIIFNWKKGVIAGRLGHSTPRMVKFEKNVSKLVRKVKNNGVEELEIDQGKVDLLMKEFHEDIIAFSAALKKARSHKQQASINTYIPEGFSYRELAKKNFFQKRKQKSRIRKKKRKLSNERKPFIFNGKKIMISKWSAAYVEEHWKKIGAGDPRHLDYESVSKFAKMVINDFLSEGAIDEKGKVKDGKKYLISLFHLLCHFTDYRVIETRSGKAVLRKVSK